MKLSAEPKCAQVLGPLGADVSGSINLEAGGLEGQQGQYALGQLQADY